MSYRTPDEEFERYGEYDPTLVKHSSESPFSEPDPGELPLEHESDFPTLGEAVAAILVIVAVLFVIAMVVLLTVVAYQWALG